MLRMIHSSSTPDCCALPPELKLTARAILAITRTDARSGALAAKSRLYATKETRPLGKIVRLVLVMTADSAMRGSGARPGKASSSKSSPLLMA